MIKAHVYEGMSAWAAYGDTRWSAVRVIKVNRAFAQVERVNPKTGEVVTRQAKARIAELVKRDPKLRGSDKPQVPPAEMFAQERATSQPADEPADEESAEQASVAPVTSPAPRRNVAHFEAYLDRLIREAGDNVW